MAYGITPTGWVNKPLEVIKTEIETTMRSIFGAGINLVPQTNVSQFIGVMADRESDIWQLGQDTYSSMDPFQATGQALIARGAMRNIFPYPATRSLVTVTATGTPTTTIPALTQFSVLGTGVKFETIGSAVIGGGGTVDIACQAVNVGPFAAFAGTLTVIETPVAGLVSVTNASDHTVLGSYVETEAAYRVRITGVGNEGSKYVEAIRAAVQNVTNVTDVYVFENEEDFVDANGLLPHSIEVVVRGGTDLAVATAILSEKPEGIAMNGTSSQVVVDSQGFNKTVKFTRPTVLNIYIKVFIKVDGTGTVTGTAYPPAGPDRDAAEALIRQALALFGDANYHVASQVIASRLEKEVWGAVPGIVDVTDLWIGITSFAATTGHATISPTYRQIADLDSSNTRIQINYV